jgi:hypothetical protein
MEIRSLGDYVVQEIENQIRLFLLETNNVSGELWVHEDRLLTSGGVLSDNGMHVLDRFSSDNTSSSDRGVSLLVSRMNSLESLESLLELRRESVVGLGVVREQSVSSGSGHLENTEEGSSRRLLLVCDIRVPGDRRQVAGKVLLVDIISLLSEDKVNLGVSLGRSGGGMNVLSSKVLCILEGVLDWKLSEILVSEDNHSSLGNEVGKLVLGLVGELGKLYTSDLRSKLGGEVINRVAVLSQLLTRNKVLFVIGGKTLLEEVGQSLVSSLTRLFELELLVRFELLRLIPARGVLRELQRRIMALGAISGVLVASSSEGGSVNSLDSVSCLGRHCCDVDE